MAAFEQNEQEGEQPTSLSVEAFHIVLEMPITIPQKLLIIAHPGTRKECQQC